MVPRLRAITYLAPGLPGPLFRAVVDHLADALDVADAGLAVESRYSGPPRGSENPFGTHEVDIGWMCTPSYFWSDAVRLVPAAMLFDDPRNAGHPCYFSDVVVPRNSDVVDFGDLRGARWVYNDTSSQSGYFNLLEELAKRGETLDFFREVTPSGSHHESLARIARGEADAAAIDSNVLAHFLRTEPEFRLSTRVITSWGPHAIQPLVASTHLEPATVRAIADALCRMHTHPEFGPILRRHGVERFVAIDESLYAHERTALDVGERLLGPCGDADRIVPPRRSTTA